MSDSNSTPVKPIRLCEFPGCERKVKTAKLCGGHYQQQSKGKPLTPLYANYRVRGTPPDIMANVEFVSCPIAGMDDCWVWIRGKNSDGYGEVKVDGKQVKVHRHMLEQKLGRPIEPGMISDHICRNPPCCNPAHLREVTRQVNNTENVIGSFWQLNLDKTHCPQGHPYDDKNTYVDKKGKRHCRICLQSVRDSRAKRKSLTAI